MSYRDEKDALRTQRDSFQERVEELEAVLRKRDRRIENLEAEVSQTEEEGRPPPPSAFEANTTGGNWELVVVVAIVCVIVAVVARLPPARWIPWSVAALAVSYATGLLLKKRRRVEIGADGIRLHLGRTRIDFRWKDIEDVQVVTQGEHTQLRILEKGKLAGYRIGKIDDPEHMEQVVRQWLDRRE